MNLEELTKFPPKLAPYAWNNYTLKIYKKLVPGLPELYKELVVKSLESPDYLENYLKDSFGKMKAVSDKVFAEYKLLESKRGINKEYYNSIKRLLIELEKADFVYYWLPIFAMGDSAFSEHLYNGMLEILEKEKLENHFSGILKIKGHGAVRNARRHARIMFLLEKHKDLKKQFDERLPKLGKERVRVAEINLKEVFSGLLLQELAKREPEAKEIFDWLQAMKQNELLLESPTPIMSEFLQQELASIEDASKLAEELEGKMSLENARKFRLFRKNFIILQKFKDIFSEQYYRAGFIDVILERQNCA